MHEGTQQWIAAESGFDLFVERQLAQLLRSGSHQ